MFRNVILQLFIMVYYLTVSLALDCNQYKNDFDVLRQFPFPVGFNLSLREYQPYAKSAVQLNEDGTFVEKIAIRNENVVPSSLFCLSNVTVLHIESTPFENDMVPDALANLKALKYLIVFFVPIKRITKQLSTLTNLEALTFLGCSLTSLPDLNNLSQLKFLNLPNNNLTHIGELLDSSLEVFSIDGNQLTEVPILKNKQHLKRLELNDNPLENVDRIILYPNLEYINLQNGKLKLIPSTIGQLQKLGSFLISDNQLTDLPDGIYNLPTLYFLDARNNLFSQEKIESIKETFQTRHPTAMVVF